MAPIDAAQDRMLTVTVGLLGGSDATVTVSAHTSGGTCVFYAQAIAG